MLTADALKQEKYRQWPGNSSEQPSLLIQPEVGEQLALGVLEGVKALPRRGLEVGGLLVGRVLNREVHVDTLCPMHSDYPEGPTFRVTERDFEAAVEAAEAQGRIVGLYRSRTDGILELDDQSRFMLRALRAEAPAVFLLVRQSRSSPAEARAGVWNGSETKWLGEPILLNGWLRGEEGSQAGTGATNLERTPGNPVSRNPILPLSVARWSWVSAPHRKRTIATGLLAFGCCAAMFSLINKDPAAVDSRSRTADPVIRETLPLASAQSVVPASTVVSESRLASPSLNSPPLDIEKVGKEQAGPLEDRMKAKEPEFQPERRTMGRGFRVPSAASATRARLPEAPSLAPAPRIAATADLEAARAASAHAVPQSPSGISWVQFTPPVLARQPRGVVVPPDLRRLLQHEVVLVLKVNVDASGRVRGVAPVSRLGKLEQALLHAYAAAVSSWEFEPATQNGQGVQSDTIMRFRVLPSP